MVQAIKEKGFTVIEALIATLIISIASLGVSNLHTNLMHANNVSAQNNEAQLLAQQKIEELRNFNSISNYNAIASGSDSTSGVNALYTRNWNVTTNTNPDYKTIQISISWQNSKGNAESLTLFSSIAKHDPQDSGSTISSSEDSAGVSLP